MLCNVFKKEISFGSNSDISRMKSAITIILLVLLSGFQLKAQGSITADYNYPKEVVAGEEFTVKITINKGDISGIARVRQEWPTGFYISEQENEGAIFSYSGQLLQFLWISLPPAKTFTITFKTKANAEYSGGATVPVKFYYLDGQERKELNLPEIKLQINGPGKKTFATFVELPGKSDEKSPVANSPATVKKEEPKTPVVQNQPKKENSQGSGKTETTKPITETKKSQPAKETAKPVIEKKPTTTPVKETLKQVEKTTAKKEAAQTVKNAPAKKEVVSFRIQIGAFPKQADKSIISKEFSISESDIIEEKHNNLFKYTTGNFPSLQAAKKVMTANPAMKGKAFVAGYKDGERIDMEEAIRLTK